jgi:hypothetical protein
MIIAIWRARKTPNIRDLFSGAVTEPWFFEQQIHAHANSRGLDHA